MVIGDGCYCHIAVCVCSCVLSTVLINGRRSIRHRACQTAVLQVDGHSSLSNGWDTYWRISGRAHVGRLCTPRRWLGVARYANGYQLQLGHRATGYWLVVHRSLSHTLFGCFSHLSRFLVPVVRLAGCLMRAHYIAVVDKTHYYRCAAAADTARMSAYRHHYSPCMTPSSRIHDQWHSNTRRHISVDLCAWKLRLSCDSCICLLLCECDTTSVLVNKVSK